MSGKTFPTINPCNGDTICDVQEGDKVRTTHGHVRLVSNLYNTLYLTLYNTLYNAGNLMISCIVQCIIQCEIQGILCFGNKSNDAPMFWGPHTRTGDTETILVGPNAF